jgi:hypothetical protein
VRSILWYDWPYIFQHRRQLVCLDNILLLTRGKPFSLTHVLFAIRPTDHLCTGVFQPEGDKEKVVGQIYQSSKMSGAHINYLLQPETGKSQDLVPLLEGLVKKAGNWGANQVVADVDIDSPYFMGFRQAGFSVLAKQNVFKCPVTHQGPPNDKQRWRTWNSADIHAMRCLYHTLVPPLVQPVEPITRREMLGLVYYDDNGDLQAYADLVYGPIGVWILPVIHPQVKEDIADLLIQMMAALPERGTRSIYITARSYQPWVEQALLDLSASPGPEQALLVRYMALRQRVKSEFAFASMENGCREPTIPLAPIKNHQN